MEGQRQRLTKTELAERRQESLSRAEHGESLTNYPTIYQGFSDKGIPESDILPRVNVFTYNAWIAKGRQVQKGEHGVKVTTFVDIEEKRDGTTGEIVEAAGKMASTATVFHITQTKERE